MPNKNKILIVDDELDVLDYLSAVFEDDGYEIITATGGKEAFELARTHRPDLITMDITMPDQTGAKTFLDLKNDPALKQIPVIVITATVNSEQSFRDLLDGIPGPEGFIKKPVNTGELINLARKIVAA